VKTTLSLGILISALSFFSIAQANAAGETFKMKANLSVAKCSPQLSSVRSNEACAVTTTTDQAVSITLDHCEKDEDGNETCEGDWDATTELDTYQFMGIVTVSKTTAADKTVSYALTASAGWVLSSDPTSITTPITATGGLDGTLTVTGETFTPDSETGISYIPTIVISPATL
jgi:hypothetical protein